MCLRPGWTDNSKSDTCSLFWSPCVILKSDLGCTLYSGGVTELQQALLAILEFTSTILLFCGIIPKKIQGAVAQTLSLKIRLIVLKNRKMNSPPNLMISLDLQHNWMTDADNWNVFYYLVVQVQFNAWFVWRRISKIIIAK